MKPCKFLLIFLFLYNIGYSQINSTEHYKTILKSPIEDFLVKEVLIYDQSLNLNDYQKQKLKEKAILYYISLRKSSNNREDKTITKSQCLLNWNYAEYVYLKGIKHFLKNKQVLDFEKHFFPKEREVKAKKIFSKTKNIKK